MGIIFDMVSDSANWGAIVAATNAAAGVKRQTSNVSRHWNGVAKKKLLEAYTD
jgi:GH25 family lysozyme M1 (1,4-beta-N-acetylmuramidase)